jgi:hypothetical protein
MSHPATNKFILTMNFGRDGLVANSRRSMLAAAERWGARFIEVRRSPVPGFGAQARLDQFAPRAGRMACFDRDMVIRDDCPSLFDLVPEGHVGFVLADQGNIADDFRQRWNAAPFNHWTRMLGGSKEYSKDTYFNSGMMVFDMPAHAHVFSRARYVLGEWNHNVTWYDVQGCLSASANLGDVATYTLPATFNLISYQQPRPLWPEYMSAYVYHFDGCRMADKVSLAHRTMWQREGWEGDNRAIGDGFERSGPRLRRRFRKVG